MKTKTIEVCQLDVPLDVMAEVANILGEHEIINCIQSGDEDEDTITIEVEYDRRDIEEKEAVEEIENIIDSYHGFDSDEDEN